MSNKGFLTKNTLVEVLYESSLQGTSNIKGFHELIFKYYHKSKLFRIECGNSFIYNQNDAEELIKDLGFADKTDFLHVHSKEFKLINLHSEMRINLVCYKEFDLTFLRFIV